MKNKIFAALIIFCLINGGVVNAVFGNTGMSFLKIGAGSRAVGMGEAHSAVVNDASATFWNPAGLARFERGEIIFSHNEWIQDISHEFFAFAFHKNSHHFGISVITNNIGGIERRVKPSSEPLGIIDAHDLAVGFSYARTILPNLQIGITAKYVYERIYVESALGMGVDLGLIYQADFIDGLQLGVVAQNLGFTSQLKEESIKLPQTMKVGAAYRLPFEFFGSQIISAIDLVKVLDEDLHLNSGIEWLIKKRLAFRAGYQTGWEEKGLHVGLGVNISRYQIDYAFTPFTANLGDSHRISFHLKL